MAETPSQTIAPAAPPATPLARVPSSFGEYIRSFGPGIVIVLTWLGAGDIVDMGVAGANYGYSLMWVLVAALMFRFVFVSLIARYQLCNQHKEGVIDGLARLHRWYAPGLFIAAVLMGHVYCSYMTVGAGEVLRNVFGGQIWMWAILCNGLGFFLVFQPIYKRLELVFMVKLAVLSISFIGCAVWVGFNPADVIKGLVRVEMPAQTGHFNPLLVALAMVGAVAGSLMNLAYPYFLEAKGWRGPQFLKVQRYDFLLGVLAMIVLNLAVWTLGAELMFPDKPIKTLADFPNLLSTVLGKPGQLLFYAGIFATVYISIMGHAAGLGYMGSHAWLRSKTPPGQPIREDYRAHPMYKRIVAWCLISPIIWTMPGMPDFVTLTLVANSAQVMLLPLLSGGLWWITASSKFIGAEHKAKPWENVVMAFLVVLAVYGAMNSGKSIVQFLEMH
jgi:Mn2+/Fe2+ NRAMP family transporter